MSSLTCPVCRRSAGTLPVAERERPWTHGLCPACESGETPSPCTGECGLDQARRTCTSCLRTTGEIMGWGALRLDQRREVYARLLARRTGPVQHPGSVQRATR